MFDVEKYKKQQKFYSQIPKYSLTSILIRVTIASIVAIVVIKFIEHISLKEGNNLSATILDYMLVIVAFNLLSEAQIVLDNILELFLPILHKSKQRIFIQLLLNIFLIIIVYNFIEIISKSINPNDELSDPNYYVAIALGLVFVTLISSILLIVRVIEKWINAQQDINELEQEKLKMDYYMLQDQLNPHFLFNNLSVLKSLIIYDRDTALKFMENF
ncbi:MAG: histidine kinase, partial [Bacteroidota bacterium]